MTTTYVRISTVYSSEVGSFSPGGSLPTITRAGVPVSDTDLIAVLIAAQTAGVFLDTSATPFSPASGVPTPAQIYLDSNGKIPISLFPVGTGPGTLAAGDDSRFGSGFVGALLSVIEAGGVYPARPASTAPVIFVGADPPSGGGSTAGGAGAVNGKDFWFRI